MESTYRIPSFNFQPNGLFFTMAELFQQRVTGESKLIICNEGGSRSSKTWDTFHFIVALCDHNRNNPLDIYIIRDTLVNCRDFTLKDWIDCLKVIGIFNPQHMVYSPKPVYKLWGHTIKFRGADDEQSSEGYPSDVLFFNEALGISAQARNALLMRCRLLAICDWNPKFTDHEIFSLEKRDDCVFTKSTYKNNRHLQPAIIKEIEAYNPDVPENVTNGTADIFRWKVYGLGERANREGLVFPNVTWIDSFPDDISEISYGCDFGQANPTAIVKIGVRRVPVKSDLYIENLFYAPTETSDVVSEVIHQLADKQIEAACEGKTFDHESQRLVYIQTLKDSDHYILNKIWCDSNMGIEKGWISDLRNRNIQALATRKFPGSRDYWISTIKRFNIHMVKNVDLRREQENFCYRVVDGIQLSETEKKHDHAWSATGYSTVGDFRIEE